MILDRIRGAVSIAICALLAIALGLSGQTQAQQISPTIRLPPAAHGKAYSHPLAAGEPTTKHTWAVIGGVLPPGLTLSPDGVLSGTPTVGGNFSFTVRATDTALGRSAATTHVYLLSVAESPRVNTPPANPPSVVMPSTIT